MRPEGSRREIGAICTEVALPVDENRQYVCAAAHSRHRAMSEKCCQYQTSIVIARVARRAHPALVVCRVPLVW